jgi:hypothetical protein
MSATNALFAVAIDELKQPVIAYGEKCLKGSIQIGDFVERFNVPVEVWSVGDYKRQWRQGIKRLLAGEFPTCLVTGMRDPMRGVFINVWPMYADHGKVVFQNKMLLCEMIRKRFSGENFYDFIESRETQTEDGEPISEWTTSRSAVAKFLNTLDSPRPVAALRPQLHVSAFHK